MKNWIKWLAIGWTALCGLWAIDLGIRLLGVANGPAICAQLAFVGAALLALAVGAAVYGKEAR